MRDEIKLMRDFGAAFNRHDSQALAAMMTDDCVFYTLAGEHEYGNAIKGADAIARAFAAVWAAMPDAHWQPLHCFADGEHGLSHWLFSGTAADGARTVAQGCDIFTFRAGKIASKNAFRKQTPNR